MNRHVASAVFAVITLQCSTLLSAAEGPDLAPVKRWIEHGASVRSVKAEFVQERQLRSLKRPLVSEGVFQFSAPESFRWQLGQPAQTVAIRKGAGELVVLRPNKKKALRYSPEALAGAGPRGAAGFLTAGFPRDFETFQKTFSVTAVEREGGDYRFTASLNDRRTALALRKIVFTVNAETLQPKSVYLRFRDGSSITTRFTAIHENARVDPGVFGYDLTGYEVEIAKP